MIIKSKKKDIHNTYKKRLMAKKFCTSFAYYNVQKEKLKNKSRRKRVNSLKRNNVLMREFSSFAVQSKSTMA